MSPKVKNILLWVLTGLVGALFLFSAFGKLSGNADALKMAEGFGISASAFMTIGIIELISVVLFVIPRTGVLGTLLLAAYMGGAIATHVQHGQDITAPLVIQMFIWIVAALRFPELTQRLLGKA